VQDCGIFRRFQPSYLDGADEILVSHQKIRHDHSKENGTNPGPNETLNRLFRRNLDELSAAKSDAADVGENVVCDNQGYGKEEPDHALKNVVHDKVGLHDHEVEGHVGPSKLGKLELVVALFERGDEKDKTCNHV
jgi:hypothetical protein